MGKCVKCGVDILDTGERCPLCQHILEHGGTGNIQAYPNVRMVARKFRFFENLVFFLSIVIESVLVYINFKVDSHILWSLIAGLILIYINVVLRFAIIGKSGYVYKTVILVITAVIILLGIDYLSGYRRWSLNYVFPGGVLAIDAAILLMMIINFRNWQSYMMSQIFMILCSFVLMALYLLGVVNVSYMVFLALAASVFLFLGTLILGDRRARNELIRRFHI